MRQLPIVAVCQSQRMPPGKWCTVFNLVAHNSYQRIPDWRGLSKQEEQALYDAGMARYLYFLDLIALAVCFSY